MNEHLIGNKFHHVHGHKSGTVVSGTYNTWRGVVQRCTNPNHEHWDYYGGRGITICDRWLYFIHFLEDMGERPAGMTLERINNQLGYFKDNCKWASRKEQANNRRKPNVKPIEVG